MEYEKKTDSKSLEWLEPHAAWLCQPKEDEEFALLPSAWGKFTSLFRKPHWDRMWTLQEVVLPPRESKIFFQCGRNYSPASAFFWLARFVHAVQFQRRPPFFDEQVWTVLTTQTFMKRVGFDRLHEVQNSRITVHSSTSVKHDQSFNTPHTKWGDGASLFRMATDPRDHIYGTLGITELPIIPDYNKSVREVFLEYAEIGVNEAFSAVMSRSGYLDSLEQTENPWSLPSWVPSWDSDRARSLNPMFTDLYDASERKLPNSNIFKKPKTQAEILSASGVICDIVTEISPEAPEIETVHGLIHHYLKQSPTNSNYLTGIPYPQAIVRVLFMDVDDRNDRRILPHGRVLTDVWGSFITWILDDAIHAKDPNWNFAEELRSIGMKFDVHYHGEDDFIRVAANEYSFGSSSTPDLPDGQDLMGEFPGDSGINTQFALLHNQLRFYRGHSRKFFLTQGGYMGLGPPSTSLGDQVCVLSDCSTPALLKNVEGHFIHKGQCFVLGLMDGEAVQDVTYGKREVEQIKIH
jgi:hypothetical protein